MRINLVALVLMGFLLGLCLPAHALKVVCDPYPVTVAQPTSFRVAYDNSTTFTASTPLTNADGSVTCNITVPTLGPGNHSVQVKACINTTDCSAVTSANFIVLVGGIPAAPTNVRISQ